MPTSEQPARPARIVTRDGEVIEYASLADAFRASRCMTGVRVLEAWDVDGERLWRVVGIHGGDE